MHLNTSLYFVLNFFMLFPHLTLLSLYTDPVTWYKNTFSLTYPIRLAFVMLLVQTRKLKVRLLPHSFTLPVEDLQFQSGRNSVFILVACELQIASFRCQVLTIPSQGFGLSQHILWQLAVKTMDTETEREILVPEVY